MQQLTAITTIAAKHGVSAVVGALTGQPGLGALAAELVATLAAGENRLGDQLAEIGSQLGEVLEQRYATAIGAGLRTLLDASTTTDPRVRFAELIRARDLFREAAASARSPIQVGLTERYLALCAIALGRLDAARTAIGLINKAALDALSDALLVTEPDGRLAQSSQAGLHFRRGLRNKRLADSIPGTVTEVVELALQLIEDARVLAVGLGHGLIPKPTVTKLELRKEDSDYPIDTAQLEIRPSEPGPVRFGPLSVSWHDVRYRPAPPPVPAGIGTLDVDVTLSIDPPLSIPLHLGLNPHQPPTRIGTATGPSVLRFSVLRAGTPAVRLTHSLRTSTVPIVGCVLTVGDVLLFTAPTMPPRPL